MPMRTRTFVLAKRKAFPDHQLFETPRVFKTLVEELPRPGDDLRSSEQLRKSPEALHKAHARREQAIYGLEGCWRLRGIPSPPAALSTEQISTYVKPTPLLSTDAVDDHDSKKGRKDLKRPENGPKTVNLRVKSACSEVFFASKGPLLRTESRLGGPVLYTLY